MRGQLTSGVQNATNPTQGSTRHGFSVHGGLERDLGADDHEVCEAILWQLHTLPFDGNEPDGVAVVCLVGRSNALTSYQATSRNAFIILAQGDRDPALAHHQWLEHANMEGTGDNEEE